MQFKHQRQIVLTTVLCGSVVCAFVVVRALADDKGCPARIITCNEKRVIRHGGFCSDEPWIGCENYIAPELCAELASCRNVTGTYPQILPRECVDCSEKERSDGGICDCVHCLNAPTRGLCQKVYNCKLVAVGSPPQIKCVQHGLCHSIYDTHTYEIACPKPSNADGESSQDSGDSP